MGSQRTGPLNNHLGSISWPYSKMTMSYFWKEHEDSFSHMNRHHFKCIESLWDVLE